MKRVLSIFALSLMLASPAAAQYVFGFSQPPAVIPQLVLNGSNTYTATALGWWLYDSSTNTYSNDNIVGEDNHIAGREFNWTYRNYFLFALPTGFEVTSAVLRVNTHTIVGSPVYTLYDYLGTANKLTGTSNSTGSTVFDDLGNGAAFGSRAFSEIESNTMVDIALNADAIASINASRGLDWAMGGRIGADNIASVPATTVPEPASFAMLGSGLVAVLFAVTRRKRV